MIRILQIVNIMNRAGLETMLMNYYRKIDKEHIQFDFLTHRQEKGAYDDEILSMGGKIFNAPRLYPQNYKNYFKYMKEFFKQHPEYQIVHSHIDAMSAFPLYAAKKNNIPIRIAHSHTSRLDKDIKLPIKYLAKMIVPRVANIYCACGEKAAQFLFPNKKVTIIHNAIDIASFQYDETIRSSIRKEFNLEEKIVIGHVGRFYYVKNQSFLLEILKEMISQNNNISLILVGDGEDENMLRNKVNELQLQDKVLFLSNRQDVNKLYQAMDIFVMPSIFEGVPVVGVEAQANGLPCLFSNNISKEILLTNLAEMISISNSPKVWAEKIFALKRKNSLLYSKKLIEKGYDVSIETNKLMDWYIKLAKSIKK